MIVEFYEYLMAMEKMSDVWVFFGLIFAISFFWNVGARMAGRK